MVAGSMDKAERGGLLREIYKKRVGCMAYQVPSKPAPKRYEPRRTEFRLVYPTGVGRPGYPSRWVIQPDAKPSVTLRPQRTAKPLPIATIAAKAPKKLSRAYPSAEALLRERELR